MEIGSPSAGQQKVVCDLAFRFIPAGTFVMGSPIEEFGRGDKELQHQVTLTKDFWMKETEVTQAEWQSVMGNNPSNFSLCGSNCPVENISWFDAVQFCNALSMQQGLTECYTLSGCNSTPDSTCNSVSENLSCTGYRLPTEAEWEYAYRAGTTTAFYNGNVIKPGNGINSSLFCEESALGDIGWYCGNASDTTHAVGGKTANAWGLYDMSGNASEWCWDLLGTFSRAPQIDPRVSSGNVGSQRVVRGGDWGTFAKVCRAAQRYLKNDGSGFRIIRSF